MTPKTDLIGRIRTAVERARAWMESRRCAGALPGVTTSSSFHNPKRWPGMCLPATYNITGARILIDGIGTLPEADKTGIADFLAGFQGPDGDFSMPDMKPDEIWKGPNPIRTRNYISAHLSNYAREALGQTAADRLLPPRFCLNEISGGTEAWLEERDWNDPWMEGNSIVNLGSGLAELGRLDLVDALIEGLNRRQDSQTGFWGKQLTNSRSALLNGFAGAMHVYHLYYFRKIPVPGAAAAVDAGLSLAAKELAEPAGACLDVDIADMLASLWPANHRRGEIRAVLESKIHQILTLQNDDGGFPDTLTGIRRFDGWAGGYWEPQGLSNAFATWFRLITLAIASSVVFPETADQWHYRKTMGIGYFDPSRLTEV